VEAGSNSSSVAQRVVVFSSGDLEYRMMDKVQNIQSFRVLHTIVRTVYTLLEVYILSQKTVLFCNKPVTVAERSKA
jgi:hypothetical protein